MLCVVGLERALQNKDAVERKISAQFPLPGREWKLLGRLARNESTAYRMLEEAVKLGWMSRRDWQSEVDRANEAEPK
jgi:hypothetical protein